MTVKEAAVSLQKILLVDDDKAMTYLNRFMLKENDINCSMDECSNGLEALTYIKNTEAQPDIIILDINMPVMDGFEFLEEFNRRPNPSEQPWVIMLSSSDTDIERCKKIGYPFVKGYFEKPLTDSDIQQILSLF